VKRIVVAYSGSERTSTVIAWLKAQPHAEIVAVTFDVGQGAALEAVRDRALAAGAVRAHVLDLREEFARDFIVPALTADALGEGSVPLGPALSRPLVAQKLVDVAAIEQAAAVAHGGAVEAGAQASVDASLRALRANVEIIDTPAPAQASGLAGVDQVEANLWGRSVRRAGPASATPLASERAPRRYPDQAVCMDVGFARGIPVSINGVEMGMVDLIGSVNVLAGAHGVGRFERSKGTEATLVEAPAATVLHAAHRALQARLSSPTLERFARLASAQYAELICAGQWFSPLRTALAAFVDRVQEDVNGTARVRLFNGACRVMNDGDDGNA
jgi:argininosuccinate synthase